MSLPGGVESPYENADGSDARDENADGSDSGDGQKGPQPYPGGPYVPGNGTVDAGQRIPDMPDVPRVLGNGSGNVSADTTALKIFADNLDTIADGVGKAWQKVENLKHLRAGGDQFVEAQTLTSKITGPRGDEGLQGNYLTSLDALGKALKDTAHGIRDIAAKYSTIEELNAKAGSDLTDLIQDAQSDIQKLQSAIGDSGTGTTTTTTGAGDTSGASGSAYPSGSGSAYPSGSGSAYPSGSASTYPSGSGSAYPSGSGSTYPSGSSGGLNPSGAPYGYSAATPSVWGALSGAAPSAGSPAAPDEPKDGDYGSPPVNSDGLTGEPAPVAEGPGPVVHPGEAVRVRLDPSAPSDGVKADDVRVRADGTPDTTLYKGSVREKSPGLPGF